MKMPSVRFIERLARSFRAACGCLALLVSAGALTAVAADTLSPSALQQIQALEAEKAARTPAQQKMDSQLVYLVKQSRHEVIAAGVTNLQIGVQADTNGLVKVDITATVTPGLLDYIAANGGSVLNSQERFHAIRALVPVGQLEALAGRGDVKFVQPAVPALRNTGSIDSQGDVTHRADVARSAFNVDGSGIKVGVLSDSVDFLSSSQATGDLPPNVTILPGQSGVPGTGEGTAMLEIIYDLAPGAQLYFATAFGGPGGFAQNILNLRSAGCDVIVDDVGYFNESPFQDGIIAQAVDSVTADGAMYFSSAGNEGNKKHSTSGTWEGDFADGGAVTAPVDGKGGNVHSFGSANYDSVTASGPAVLFWSDPLGASTNDYDLYVLDATGANIVGSSTTVQNGSQDPYEIVSPALTGDRIVIVKAKGDPRFLHLSVLRGTLAVNTDGETKGHACATNAYCVAATDVANSFPNPFTGGSRNPVESFSSDGPRRMYYQADGTPYTPGSYLASGGIVRQKPDITAADGVATSVPGFNPFYGTSAAAPHAGAIAALLKSYNSALTTDQIRAILTGTALDIEAAGVDENAGSGIVMAYEALQASPPPAPLPKLLLVTNTVTGGNGNGMIDPNECNYLNLVLTNAGAADATAIQMTLLTTNTGVAVLQKTLTYPGIPAGGLATNLPPFRISTTPEFVCGTPIDFMLILKSDQVTRTNFFRINTGVVGDAVRFDNNTPYPIPDYDPVGASSPIFVNGLAGAVGKVQVALYITHTYVSDLRLELIAPDGTTCLLAANVGGSGKDFGAGCIPDTIRTVFDDDATNSITTGTAPFVGTFLPSQPLAVFKGKSGFAANGIWQLHVVDGAPLDTGTIQCWSLSVSPALCTDGGGQCPGVDLAIGMIDNPDPVVIGSNLVYTISVTNNGPNTAKSVVVTHGLPSTVLYVSATTSQGSVSQAGGIVTANLGTMPLGATATIRVTVLPAVAGTITSTATVASSEPELDPSNNSVTISTSVLPPVSDLAVSLASTPNPTVVGGELTYTTTVTNNGPATATGIVVSNALPASVLINSAASSQGSVVVSGNIVMANIGTLPLGGLATVTIGVTPLNYGTIYATASASGNQPDPVPANNTVTIGTAVGQSADLGLTLVDQPDPVVVRSNLTYLITVTNRGPNVATNVVANQALPPNVTVVSTTLSQGTSTRTGNNLVCNLGTLAVGTSATIKVVVTSPNIGTLSTTASVSAGQGDPNPADNSATATTTVAAPFVSVVAAGATLTKESQAPANGAVDVGETVTVNLRLRNAGNVNNTNLVATLLATNGVTAPSDAQTYGVLPAAGLPVSRPFTFTAAGTNGGVVVATLQLTDGTNVLAPVNFTFNLANVTTFQNPALITIPDIGAATPYPSVITVSGITGTVGNVSVTLSNLSHTYPGDLDILLVGPTGQKSILMSSAGQPFSVTNTTVTFDDTAASPVPDASQILGTSYQPAAYNPSPSFPDPAPAGPYNAALSVFSLANPNGAWSLYIVDHTDGDHGKVANGWSLAITTVSPVNRLADLGLSVAAAPDPVQVGTNLTYTFSVTNQGPDAATGVAISDILPDSVQLISVSASQGSVSTNSGLVVANLGSLNANAAAKVTLVVSPTAAGVISNSASVIASEIDLNPANNTVTTVNTAVLPVADLGLTLSASAAAATVGSNLTYTASVTNSGPSTALSVVLSDLLPVGVGVVAVNPSQGTWTNVNGAVTCQLGNLIAGTAASVDVTVTPLVAGQITNTITVGTVSSDPNPANNAATLVTPAATPVAHIVAAGAHLLAESFVPADVTIEPGETVTLSLSLANDGQAATSNLVATLQPTGGVTAPSAPQNYGSIGVGGSAVAMNFTFTAASNAVGAVTATLQLSDGATSLGSVTFGFGLPTSTTFSNSTAINIPDHGPALPYPSPITVAGVTGLVSAATVTLNGITHAFPDDINILLVGPRGQKVLVLSGVGGGQPVTNLVLTLDDTASAALPDASQLTSGTYQPTAYKLGTVFPRPAPSGTPATKLAAFNTSDPNGVWSLYVFDDTIGDGGVIAEGWSLTLTTVAPVNPIANLGVVVAATPASIFTGAHVTYTLSITNGGPDAATGVTVSNALPVGAGFVSAALSQGSYLNAGGLVSCSLGTLPVGGKATVIITAAQTAAGNLTNRVAVVGNENDLDLSDNSALAVTVVANPLPSVLTGVFDPTNRLFRLTLTGQPGETYVFQASTNLTSWTALQTNVAPGSGVLKYNDARATNYVQRFYRGVRIPLP